MDELIAKAWAALVRRSEADRTTRSYTWWAKLNFELDKTLIMVSETMFREALREALDDSEIAEFVAFLSNLDRQAAEQRMIDSALLFLEIEEHTADW